MTLNEDSVVKLLMEKTLNGLTVFRPKQTSHKFALFLWSWFRFIGKHPATTGKCFLILVNCLHDWMWLPALFLIYQVKYNLSNFLRPFFQEWAGAMLQNWTCEVLPKISNTRGTRWLINVNINDIKCWCL